MCRLCWCLHYAGVSTGTDASATGSVSADTSIPADTGIAADMDSSNTAENWSREQTLTLLHLVLQQKENLNTPSKKKKNI